MSQISDRTTSREAQLTVSVVIVGPTDRELFQPLRNFLRKERAVQIRAECRSIRDALNILPDLHSVEPQQQLPVDVVVVLQSHSDEYCALDVQLLIGRMLFGRVICCYGPWCLSDGRSHTIWPVSCRVPVASAPTLLAAEFHAVRHKQPALSPMSAAEEVFVHRNFSQLTLSSEKSLDFCVVSDDRVLRDSVARLCQEICHQRQSENRSSAAVVKTPLNQARGVLESRDGLASSLIVLVDLDPLDQTCRDLLDWLAEHFTGTVIGITVFAESSFSLPRLDEIFDKLELAARLRELPALSKP